MDGYYNSNNNNNNSNSKNCENEISTLKAHTYDNTQVFLTRNTTRHLSSTLEPTNLYFCTVVVVFCSMLINYE